jgi:hypothetical protein
MTVNIIISDRCRNDIKPRDIVGQSRVLPIEIVLLITSATTRVVCAVSLSLLDTNRDTFLAVYESSLPVHTAQLKLSL